MLRQQKLEYLKIGVLKRTETDELSPRTSEKYKHNERAKIKGGACEQGAILRVLKQKRRK
jgi:hypothetical protein